MRTIAIWLIASVASVHVLWTHQDIPLLRSGFSAETSWLRKLDIDKLDPANIGDYSKILLLLRCEDIPQAKRIEYAYRYIRGEYAFAKEGALPNKQEMHGLVITDAVKTLAHLNHVASISLLEEKLQQWEAMRQRPPEQQTAPVPWLNYVRAALARLKAVRDIPEVKTPVDLRRRLERMLHHVGFNGSIPQWLEALTREIEARQSIDHGAPMLYELLLWEYGHQLMQSGWHGMDIDAAAKEILDSLRRAGRQVPLFEVYLELGKVPREKLAQWIVEDAMSWQGIGTRAESKSQMLVDMGTSVVPLVWEKIAWALQHRDKVQGTGMGLVALLEVLVTLGGEQALPLIEPYTRDENEWVRHYACRAKEYIQQGKVFLFAPYF
ncbi:MAG: hypothetical protein KatS3mg019_1064 [Fimbriimonadales bacterium]|nr:MAG: hypothetical protein KatS3mg019_1064 [Fimbriimonadales bacterium]